MNAVIKPDFVVAGGMRCATGWIRQCLKEHPDIYMPRKEPHYYDRNYERGVEWYQSFFEDYLGEQVIGEKTATYFHYSETSGNIMTTNPEMKVIICLRDPVKRMYSHFSMFSRSDKTLKDIGFIASVTEDSEFVQWSRYASQAKLFKDTISENNLKFIIYEDKDNDPVGFIQDLYKFLGVSDSFIPVSANVRTKQGQFEHNHWFWGPVSRILLHPRTPTSFRKLYTSLRPDINPDIDESTYKTLSRFFMDIPQLEELLDRKLDCWRTRRYVD